MNDKAKSAESGSLRPPDGRPTLKTIAFMTGLGVTTVSRALKDAPDISADTKQRVQLVARQVGYRPNRAGVRLRTGKTNVISLLLNTDEQLMGFISDIIYGISQELAGTPYHIILTPYSGRNDPMDPVRYVVETQSADGIIISRTEPHDQRVKYMTERGFPFATHGRTNLGIDHPWHDFDNHAFARLAVGSLAARGRRRLALLAPEPSLSYHQHMTDGFAEAVAEAGLNEIPFKTAWVDQPIDDIRARVMDLLNRPNRPDGIVCGSGTSALAVVNAIESCGLTLGREIDVATKQSTKLVQMFRPQLFVVNEDFRLAGRELARALLGSIASRPVRDLQSLSVPDCVVGPEEEAQLFMAKPAELAPALRS
ncbi:MAG: substrate-binding domain-containing protein [Rhizobiaceae bacterium]|nr:substrate-binding domain-containing protein [Rhizobiaceae bacterium]